MQIAKAVLEKESKHRVKSWKELTIPFKWLMKTAKPQKKETVEQKKERLSVAAIAHWGKKLGAKMIPHLGTKDKQDE